MTSSKQGAHRADPGRYLIDVTSGITPKQFIRGKWFVGVAFLTGAVWMLGDWAGPST